MLRENIDSPTGLPEFKITACWARANSDPELLEFNYDIRFEDIGMEFYGCHAHRFRGEWGISELGADVTNDAASTQLDAVKDSRFMTIRPDVWAILEAEITRHMEHYARNLFRIAGRASMDLFADSKRNDEVDNSDLAAPDAALNTSTEGAAE
jgi:hypothetical protein